MNIYVSIENNKVKNYQIGSSSESVNIPVPPEYTLNDLRFLNVNTIIINNEHPIMEFDPETNEMVPVLDENGNPILDSYETIEYQFEFDQEAKDQYEADQASEYIENQRNEKLKLLRSLRDEKLKEVDIMINEVVLQLRDDREDIAAYRQSLMEFTDPYRYVNDPNKAKIAIDSLDLDNINWPEKP